MNERQIDENEAVDILSLWHREERPVEVILRFGQGLTQSHPGRVTIQPEGQLVVADITDRDHYLSTILDIFAFENIKLSESENVMMFEEPLSAADRFSSVTVACREQ
jgi:hypothetical protein